jgi:succinyl-diaminopimelate desuccinylase
MNALDLTRELLAFPTVNPPGQEDTCARHVGKLLETAGFAVTTSEFAPQRTSLVARIGGSSDRAPLCFTGHLDVVPLGARPWRCDPFAGELDDGRLYGRGTSDMKSGLAAFIVVATRLARRLGGSPGLLLVITAGEETGCEGAQHLARLGTLGRAGALVVAEPTGNHPMVGHKGALWLEARTAGVTAHGSMPEHGVNAIFKAARAVTRLEHFDFGSAAHPVLGRPSLNVGTIRGGLNFNSVPDAAAVGIDIRTVPDQKHAELAEQLAAYLGDEVTLETLVDTAGVWSAPDHPWIQDVFEIAAATVGEQPVLKAAPYVTDASALVPALAGPPTVILGPGELTLAHQTDEYCRLDRLEQAVEIYTQITRRWCGV